MDSKCVQCFSKSGTRSIRVTYRVLRNVNYLALPETFEIRNSGGGTQQFVFSQAHCGLQMASTIWESPLLCTTSQPFGFGCLVTTTVIGHLLCMGSNRLHRLLASLCLVTTTVSGHLLCGGANNFPQVPPDSAFPYAWVPHVLSLFQG